MSTTEKELHIDIPVKLSDVKVVFSIASLSFEGDLPASIFHLQLIVNDVADWKPQKSSSIFLRSGTDARFVRRTARIDFDNHQAILNR